LTNAIEIYLKNR